MAWNGSGTYTRTNGTFSGTTVWADDRDAGTKITAANHDTHDQDLATGINAALAKNGENAPTANLPMGSYKHTGVAAASGTGARTEYVSAASLQDGKIVAAADTGAADAYVVTLTPAITAYAAYQRFIFKAANANTGASTLAVNGLAATAIKKHNDQALEANDIEADGIYEVVYDGTNFQLISPVSTQLDSADIGVSVQGYDADTAKLDTAQNWSAAQNLADQILQRPVIKDYGETVNAIGSIGGGTQDIDLTLGNVVTGTVDTSETTFTFSNPPASGTAGSFTLILTNGGSQTVNWPASVDWAGGAAPTLTASGVDILVFFTVDGGTIWYGFSAGISMS